MDLTARYPEDSQYASILRTKVSACIYNFEYNDVETKMKTLMDRKSIGSYVINKIDIPCRFSHNNKSIIDYVNDDSSDLIQFVRSLFIQQIALYRLTFSGKLMPIEIYCNLPIELNIDHSSGNCIFKYQPDMFPFSKFIVIK